VWILVSLATEDLDVQNLNARCSPFLSYWYLRAGPGAKKLLETLEGGKNEVSNNGSDGRASPEPEIDNKSWARRTVASSNLNHNAQISLKKQLQRSNTRSLNSVSKGAEADARSKGHDLLSHLGDFKARSRVLDIVSSMTMQKTTTMSTLETAQQISKLPWAKKNLMDKVSS
jgi:hypothetical protein